MWHVRHKIWHWVTANGVNYGERTKLHKLNSWESVITHCDPWTTWHKKTTQTMSPSYSKRQRQKRVESTAVLTPPSTKSTKQQKNAHAWPATTSVERHYTEAASTKSTDTWQLQYNWHDIIQSNLSSIPVWDCNNITQQNLDLRSTKCEVNTWIAVN